MRGGIVDQAEQALGHQSSIGRDLHSDLTQLDGGFLHRRERAPAPSVGTTSINIRPGAF